MLRAQYGRSSAGGWNPGETRRRKKLLPRLAQARWEIQQAKQYTYLVLNDSGGLARCIAQVEAILADLPEAQCCRYENNTNLPILKEVF